MSITPDRWELVEEIYHAALERDPDQRASFLSEACNSDPQLLEEVESLLAAHERPGSFIDSPACEIAAKQLLEGQYLKGQIIGEYKIIALLGKGGMGEVYEAKDLRLNRTIALKLLPPQLIENRERLRRFTQEAKAASALNHPNIITVHEMSQADDTYYIATEFIIGQTLRARLNSARMDIVEALDVAIQVASALEAAHGSRIVHRDIKPENIMLRPDGYVKVLDFGLATFAERQSSISEADSQPITWMNTDPGVIMGTARYMSPEQARGVTVDARTDIFSLGIVLYEMVAGQRPFEGETATDVIASILKSEPPPLAEQLSDAPPELEWIISKALRKNRDERYQTAKGMLGDLKNLKQELEIRAKLAQPSSSELSPAAVSQSRPAQSLSQRPDLPATPTGSFRSITSTLSTEYVLNEINNHRKSAMAILILMVFLIGAIGFWVSRWIGPRDQPAPFQKMKLSRLTDGGNTERAAVSPDGKYVAYVVAEAGQQSLWFRQVATEGNIQVIPPSESAYQGLTFSKEGDYIYYTLWDKKNPPSLYQVPVLRGNSRKLMENVDGPIAFSPDGDRFAFVRERNALIIANADGSGERVLARREESGFWRYPAWSPDGKAIASGVGNYNASGDYVVEVSVKDGAQRTISAQKWFRVYNMSWLSDGSGLVMIASDQESRLSQIWNLSYPDGSARRITNDLNSYHGASLTADSSGLVCVLANRASNIWVIPNADSNLARQITSESINADGLSGLSPAPDSRIVYASGKSGNQDIWIVEANGTGQKQLTFDAATDYYPAVSPDGRYIVFASDRAGDFNIWRMDIDGSNLRRLTDRGGEGWPQVSPDGRWVVYNSINSNQWTLWKVSIDGGAPVRLTEKDSGAPAISPDGKFIACLYWEDASNPSAKIAVIPFEGGPPLKVLDISSAVRSSLFRWSPDSRALTFMETIGGVSNIWSRALDGSPPKQLTNFKNDRIFGFQWSRDGRQLICSRGSETTNVVLIRDFK